MRSEPGLCECGCGGQTSIAERTDSATRGRGRRVKGQPLRFILGHSGRLQKHVGPEYERRDCGYTTSCWVWIRATDKLGYGRLSGGALAHVAEWQKRNPLVPRGLELDHLCRVPACVNPAHLEPVTHAENLRRGKGAKLTAEGVREIRVSAESRQMLAAKFGVSSDTIRAVLNYRTWKDIV